MKKNSRWTERFADSFSCIALFKYIFFGFVSNGKVAKDLGKREGT
jgi:hypothetical protein